MYTLELNHSVNLFTVHSLTLSKDGEILTLKLEISPVLKIIIWNFTLTFEMYKRDVQTKFEIICESYPTYC